MADRKITQLPAAEATDLTNANTVLHVVNPDRVSANDRNRKATWAQTADALQAAGLASLSGTQTFTGGNTFAGKVIFQGQIETTPGSNLGTSGTLTLDLDGASILSTGTLTNDITFATSNRAAGRSVTVRVVNGSTTRTLTFPAGWRFVGAKPDDIEASKVGILTITAFGTADSDILAAWAVEE